MSEQPELIQERMVDTAIGDIAVKHYRIDMGGDQLSEGVSYTISVSPQISREVAESDGNIRHIIKHTGLFNAPGDDLPTIYEVIKTGNRITALEIMVPLADDVPTDNSGNELFKKACDALISLPPMRPMGPSGGKTH